MREISYANNERDNVNLFQDLDVARYAIFMFETL